MSQIPENLYYSSSHEWLDIIDEKTVIVGITDFAQEALGDIVFVELPKVGRNVLQNDACAVVESVKAASDIYVPVSGEILEVNTLLENTPDLLNSDPYKKGWLFKLKMVNTKELPDLLSAEKYKELIG